MSWFTPRQQETQEQQDILTIYGLTEQQVEQSQSGPTWECGWCMPHTPGATTGICPECEATYFPKKH